MSRTTESLHVRGVACARVIRAIDDHLRAEGFVRIVDEQRKAAGRDVADVVRVVLRRDGRWTTFADSRGSGRATARNLDDWAESLSRALDRSVLAVFTWDGEEYVTATRWKRGRKRGAIATPVDVRRDPRGIPRAPAKALWPWLPKPTRTTILRDGVPITAPAATTGDEGLDDLLEDFDDVQDDVDELPDGPDGQVYVGLLTSVEAIGRAIGMKNPWMDPWAPQAGDVELLFRPQPKG